MTDAKKALNDMLLGDAHAFMLFREEAEFLLTAWTADRERAERAGARVAVLEAALEPFVNAIKWSKLDFLHLDISKISADDLRTALAAKEQSE